jgi:multidrug efflux system membrane fusion protein
MNEHWEENVMRHTFITAALFAACGLLLAGCSKHTPHAERPPSPVITFAAFTTNVPVYIRAFGTICAYQNVSVMPQVSGKLLQVHFTEGQVVTNNQLLFTIDPRDFDAELKKAEATLEMNRADLKLKRDTRDRNLALVRDKVVSQEAFEKCQLDVDLAEARVKLDEASVAQAKLNVEYSTVESPLDGVTGKVLVDAGNVVNANTTRLVSVRQLSPLYVDFSVSEQDLEQIRAAKQRGTLKVHFMPERQLTRIEQKAQGKVGEAYEAVIREFIGQMYAADLAFMDNTVGDNTGAIALRAIVRENTGKFWPGQFVRIGLIVENRANAVLVPELAIQAGKNGPYVFVVKPDHTAELRLIKQGPATTGHVIVEQGVQAGERVVLQGQMGLYPGAKTIEIPSGK